MPCNHSLLIVILISRLLFGKVHNTQPDTAMKQVYIICCVLVAGNAMGLGIKSEEKQQPSLPSEHHSLKNEEKDTLVLDKQSRGTCDCSDDPPEDCLEILSRNPTATSGTYQINVGDRRIQRMITVFCDMDNDGGGWTVIQRRVDGDQDFYLNYQTYAEGFGDLNHEFWIGNENLHHMTSRRNYELHINLEDFSGETRFAHYQQFQVDSACNGFELNGDGFTGDAGDSLQRSFGHKFSTFDRDQDASGNHCAVWHHGAGWYSLCGFFNLNGLYQPADTVGVTTISWWTWNNAHKALKGTAMKIRPALQSCPLE